MPHSLNYVRWIVIAASMSWFCSAARADDLPPGILFAQSPGSEWTCGLTIHDFPSLKREGFDRELAVGCRNGGGAIALAVITDASNAGHAITAAEMAGAFEEQATTDWKLATKNFTTVTLTPTSLEATFYRFSGPGDGVSLSKGTTPTLALGANAPIWFRDASGIHQVIIVFRMRAKLPLERARQEPFANQLEKQILAWANTIQIDSAVELLEESAYNRLALARKKKDKDNKPGDVPDKAITTAAANIPHALPIDEASEIAAILIDGASPNHLLSNAQLLKLNQVAREAYGTPLGEIASALLAEQKRKGIARLQYDVIDKAFQEAPAADKARVAALVAGPVLRSGDLDMIAQISALGAKRGLKLGELRTGLGTMIEDACSLKARPPLAQDAAAFFDVDPVALAGALRAERHVGDLPAIASKRGDSWRLNRGIDTGKLPMIVFVDSLPAIVSLDVASPGQLKVERISNLLQFAGLKH
ncbi:MAG TPA: hypothetical protein VEZ11_00285 [Thermoanaerobaculia bacterium]|nr:hypothetical protein [Thermoanaerobaculia bacterium]